MPISQLFRNNSHQAAPTTEQESSQAPPPSPEQPLIRIVCPLCTILFSCTPILLWCGHSVCRDCILFITRSRVKCPICLEESRGTRKNYILQEAVERLYTEHSKQEIDKKPEKEKMEEMKTRISDLNTTLMFEAIEWDNLHDLKQREYEDFVANSGEVLGASDFLYLALTILIVGAISLTIWKLF